MTSPKGSGQSIGNFGGVVGRNFGRSFQMTLYPSKQLRSELTPEQNADVRVLKDLWPAPK
jgi:hypothetical protein